MPLEEAIGIYRKLGSLDPDQMVYVVIERGVPATSLVETIHHLQEAGLHDLVLMSPAQIGGKSGMYQITVDSTKRAFGGCIAGLTTESGFHEMPEIDEEAFEQSLKELNSQQGGGEVREPRGGSRAPHR